MTELQRYLTEEIALDHADGHLTRREALRRLALMGLSVAAASSLLSACTKDVPGPAAAPADAATSASPPPQPAASAPAAPVVLPPSVAIEAIVFAGPEGRKLQAGWAPAAAKPKGAILVIHENKGLNDHTRHVAGRFGHVGYSALAIDLLSAEGGTASLGDPAQATAALGKVAPERFVADLRASLDELARRVAGVKLGAIGFCFGGGMTWRLVGLKDPRLAAAAPFYGPLPEGADFTGTKTATLGVYAEQDERVNATRDAAKAALEKAGAPHEIVTYPGVNHAFFNDTGPRYNAGAATQAWTKVLDWFGRHVG